MLTDDRFEKAQDFLSVAIDSGVLQNDNGVFLKDASKFSSPYDFHRARIDNPVEVMANAVEPLFDLQKMVGRLASLPQFWVRRKLAKHLMEKAIREYEAAIAINANIADLHLSLGRNYRVLGVYDKAVEEFTRANALNPGDPTPDLYISRTYATVGEYAKATQYAETAVNDNPGEANLRGNLGVMYYRNFQWPEAVEQLKIVVAGGATEDNQPIEPIALVNDTRIAEYYFTYGLVLARLNRCGEALQVAQQIQARVPADEIAVANAEEVVNICQQNLAATPTPELLLLPTETLVPDTITPTPGQ